MTLAESEAETLVRVHSLTGPSYAGHGPLAGQLVHVLRLGMCNLACGWCDQPDTVAALGADLDTTAPLTTVTALILRLLAQLDGAPEVPLLITGGEPLVQDYAVLAIVQGLSEAGSITPVWVETNGTKPPPDWWDNYITGTVVSPKIGTHDAHHKRLPDKPMRTWAAVAARSAAASMVFTVGTRSEVRHAVALCAQLDLSPADCWVTPRGAGLPQMLQSVALIHNTVKLYGFRLSPRIGPLLDTDFT